MKLLIKKSYFLKIIREKNFLKIWSSQLLSQITTNLINFILILKIFEKTHSAVAVSMVWFFYALPAILVGPFSGTIIDLMDKRKILIVTNLAQAVIVLGYLLSSERVLIIYPIVFLYSLVNQLYLPAEGSTMPLLVPKNFYPFANSIFLFTAYGSFIAGFTIAGPLVKSLGQEMPFYLSSLFLFLAAFSVFLLPKTLASVNGKIGDYNDFINKVKEGYVFIKKNKMVLLPLILIAISQIILGILGLVVPLYATKILLLRLVDSALVLISPAGLGAIIGSGLLVKYLINKIRKKRIITFGLFLGSFALFSLGYIVPHLSIVKIGLAMICSFILGISFVCLLIPSQTLIRDMTPNSFLGRTYGVLGFLITVASILPILLSGTVAELLGVKSIFLTISLVLGGLGFYISKKETYEYLSS